MVHVDFIVFVAVGDVRITQAHAGTRLQPAHQVFAVTGQETLPQGNNIGGGSLLIHHVHSVGPLTVVV
ncbi:hypothetical protein Gain_0039_100 [Komagataeibacter intermedius TF2]|nr:hypothetical protein Gain_0039_100 [Komagataeibacter intermedius TF2]